jgi:hypothetical protein
MESLLINNNSVNPDLLEIIKYFTDDTNRQFAEIMDHVKMLYDLYKLGMGNPKNKFKKNIIIKSIYFENKLGKNISYNTWGKYQSMYYNYTDNEFERKYPFWRDLSNNILYRLICNINNSYANIYEKLPYSIKISYDHDWPYLEKNYDDKKDYTTSMCHYIVLNIKIDFASKPNLGKITNKSNNTQVITDENIYLQMAKLI